MDAVSSRIYYLLLTSRGFPLGGKCKLVYAGVFIVLLYGKET